MKIPIRLRRQFAKANWPVFQQELLTIFTPTTNHLTPPTQTLFFLIGLLKLTPLQILKYRKPPE